MTKTKLSTQWNGESIRYARVDKGWSQQKLADNLGCRMQTVSEWENGKYLPQNAYQKLLSKILSR